MLQNLLLFVLRADEVVLKELEEQVGRRGVETAVEELLLACQCDICE